MTYLVRVSHIGTLREKPLHASVKAWYSEPGDLIEHPVDRYVIDIVRGDLLIEVQTGGFSSMKAKLASLLDGGHRVRIVHPIASEKWIVRCDDDGTILDRRKSPKRGDVLDVFSELVAFPQVLNDPLVELEVLMVKVDEMRVHQPGKAWRRRGWVVAERHLLEVDSAQRIDDPLSMLPSELPSQFTTRDLAEATVRPMRSAQQMVYCLRESGSLETVGKVGNSLLYRSPHCS